MKEFVILIGKEEVYMKKNLNNLTNKLNKKTITFLFLLILILSFGNIIVNLLIVNYFEFLSIITCFFNSILLTSFAIITQIFYGKIKYGENK